MRWLVAAALVMACGGKKTTYDLRSFDDVMDAWLPDAAKQAWQGAWVMTLDDKPVAVSIAVPSPEAIDRQELRAFDGKAESIGSFELARPCEARIVVNGRATRVFFAWADGKLVVGNGGVGMRRGEEAVVCGAGRDDGAPEEGVYAVTGNKCTTWKQKDGSWGSRDGVCVWANARGLDLLEVGTEHYLTRTVVTGELCQSQAFEESMMRREHARAASFAEAKAIVNDRIANADPVAAARAAGGTVGDLSSVAGLQATFADNKNAVAGRDLEVPGAFVETSTLTVQGQVWNVVVLGDPDHPNAKKLLCQTQDATSALATGARVVVKGRMDITQDHLRLRPCSLVR